MKEPWVEEAKQNAKFLAEIFCTQIVNEADDLSVDREWFFEKVVQCMRVERGNVE